MARFLGDRLNTPTAPALIGTPRWAVGPLPSFFMTDATASPFSRTLMRQSARSPIFRVSRWSRFPRFFSRDPVSRMRSCGGAPSPFQCSGSPIRSPSSRRVALMTITPGRASASRNVLRSDFMSAPSSTIARKSCRNSRRSSPFTPSARASFLLS